MELQLQELLERIKREGVDTARVEAERITAEAQERARMILADAEREAATVRERAKADAKRAEESGRAALEQASRNVLLAFRESVQALLDTLVRQQTQGAYGAEVLAQAIPAVVTALAKGGAEDLAVLVPEQTVRALEERFRAALSAEIRRGVTLKAGGPAAGGFHVSEKGGSAYYDFSAAAVAELLSAHLNTRLAEILKGAARGM